MAAVPGAIGVKCAILSFAGIVVLALPSPLLGTLRRRELNAVGARLADEIGMRHSPPATGELVAGTLHQRLTLTSGRFAIIGNGLGFPLVPWTPAIDRYLGRHIAGVARKRGGTDSDHL